MPHDQVPYQVWHYNQKVYHYRIPIWDGVAEAGRDRFTLRVMGETRDGEAIGGGKRDYIHHVPVKGSRMVGTRWEGAEQAVTEHQPDVVIFNSTPRFKSSWTVPPLVRKYGGVTIAWTKSHSYSKLPDFILNGMKRRLMKRYDYVIAYGQQTRDELLQLGVPDERIIVAQNTVDTRPIFEQQQKYLDMAAEVRKEQGLEDRRILLDIGRMEDAKRHEDVIRAWPEIRKLDDKLVLVLVSGGPKLEDYRQLAQQIDPERIRVMGRVPIGHDYAWIAASDMTIQCGAVGLAINQSMAFGKPTIIADQIGVDTELIEHGKTGWRFPEGDLPAMIRTIKHVMDHPDERQAVTERAKVLVRDEANVQNMIRQVHRCVEAALDLREQRRSR